MGHRSIVRRRRWGGESLSATLPPAGEEQTQERNTNAEADDRTTRLRLDHVGAVVVVLVVFESLEGVAVEVAVVAVEGGDAVCEALSRLGRRFVDVFLFLVLGDVGRGEGGGRGSELEVGGHGLEDLGELGLEGLAARLAAEAARRPKGRPLHVTLDGVVGHERDEHRRRAADHEARDLVGRGVGLLLGVLLLLLLGRRRRRRRRLRRGC
mmetsp:Transcript_14574/g.44159  ORF Transcript_14574/g.44159 Transcript_14574/m.44159 type:complete len:210 (+) Transcript_14574:205-834(+)